MSETTPWWIPGIEECPDCQEVFEDTWHVCEKHRREMILAEAKWIIDHPET